MISKSDIRNPLGFFEDWITEDNILSKYKDFQDKYENYGGYVDNEKGLFYYTNGENGSTETENLVESFQESIKDLLYEKLQESKRYIDDYFSENKQQKTLLKNYVNDKISRKREKIYKSKVILEKFPVLFKPIESIIEHINSEYPDFTLTKVPIIASEQSIPAKYDLTNKSNIQRISIVLEFLNQHSKNGLRFLSESDFEIFINSIEKLANGEFPKLSKQIEFSNVIDNNALNYILRIILFPYIKNNKFKLIHFKRFLNLNVNIYLEEKKAETFYAGTIKIPNIKEYSLNADYIEWWLRTYSS